MTSVRRLWVIQNLAPSLIKWNELIDKVSLANTMQSSNWEEKSFGRGHLNEHSIELCGCRFVIKTCWEFMEEMSRPRIQWMLWDAY